MLFPTSTHLLSRKTHPEPPLILQNSSSPIYSKKLTLAFLLYSEGIPELTSVLAFAHCFEIICLRAYLPTLNQIQKLGIGLCALAPSPQYRAHCLIQSKYPENNYWIDSHCRALRQALQTEKLRLSKLYTSRWGSSNFKSILRAMLFETQPGKHKLSTETEMRMTCQCIT